MLILFQEIDFCLLPLCRIQLPPQEVLEYIQASALQEHYNFVDQSSAGGRQTSVAVTKQAAEPLCPLTWRDARYQEMLRTTKPSRPQGIGSREPSMLANIRSFMNKVVVTTSSLGSTSSTAETSYSKRSKSSLHVTDKEREDKEMAEGDTEHKDPEMGLELAPSTSVDMQVETTRACAPTRTHSWAWVAEHDELSLAMKNGWVLYGFVEAPINFPPSFKWKPNASAGNFTDMPTLQDAYTTRKKNKEGQSALRPPSYTDRITCSSQRDSKGMLKIKKYDMCDAICASDHRPVSAAIDIFVRDLPPEKEKGKDNGNEKDKGSASPAASGIGSGGQTLPTGFSSALPETARLINIRLYNLQIRWLDSLTSASSLSAPIPLSVLRFVSMRSSSFGSRQGSFGSILSKGSSNGSLPMESVAAHTCMVYFPLQNEDPFSEFRKPLLINQALDVGTDPEGGLLTGRHVRYIHTFRLSELKDGVMEIRTLACMARAR